MLAQAQEMFAKVIDTAGGDHWHVPLWHQGLEYAEEHDDAVIDLLRQQLVGVELSNTDCDCGRKTASLTFQLQDAKVSAVTCGDDAEEALDNLVKATMPCLNCLHRGFFGYHWNAPDGTGVDVELLMVGPGALDIGHKFILSEHYTEQWAEMDTDEADEPYDEARLNARLAEMADVIGEHLRQQN